MKKYIGIKSIQAEPMSRKEFDTVMNNLNTDIKDFPGYKVKYPDGYVSWSPKAVFEEAYYPTEGLKEKEIDVLLKVSLEKLKPLVIDSYDKQNSVINTILCEIVDTIQNCRENINNLINNK